MKDYRYYSYKLKMSSYDSLSRSSFDYYLTYYEKMQWAGNTPYGFTPISKQKFEQEKFRLCGENKDWKKFFEDMEQRLLRQPTCDYKV